VGGALLLDRVANSHLHHLAALVSEQLFPAFVNQVCRFFSRRSSFCELHSLLSSFGRQSPPRRTPPPCHLAEFRGEAFGICATLLTAYFGCQRSSVGFSSVTHIFQATNPIPTRPPRASLSFPEPHLLHRENAAATLQAD
jgi:hypothetical protein